MLKAEWIYPNTSILQYAGIPIRHLRNLKLYKTCLLSYNFMWVEMDRQAIYKIRYIRYIKQGVKRLLEIW